MVDQINAAGGCAGQPAESRPGVDAFLAKAAGGLGIEELILQDTRAQRKAGTAIRKAQREQRRRLIERAMEKMKAAADDRFFSSLTGALSGLGAEVLGVAIQSKWTRAVCEGTKLLGGSLARHLVFETPAAYKEGDAKLLQDAARASGDAVRDTGEWLASALELERRMVDRMDQLTRFEHESRMSVLNRIGA